MLETCNLQWKNKASRCYKCPNMCVCAAWVYLHLYTTKLLWLHWDLLFYMNKHRHCCGFGTMINLSLQNVGNFVLKCKLCLCWNMIVMSEIRLQGYLRRQWVTWPNTQYFYYFGLWNYCEAEKKVFMNYLLHFYWIRYNTYSKHSSETGFCLFSSFNTKLLWIRFHVF